MRRSCAAGWLPGEEHTIDVTNAASVTLSPSEFSRGVDIRLVDRVIGDHVL